MDSATKMTDPSTGSAYGPLSQGAGLINAYDAVISQATGCANVGLDIQADLNGVAHFQGPVFVNETGELAVQLSNGDVLIEGFDWGDTDNLGFDWGTVGANGFDWGEATMMGFDWGSTAMDALGFDWGDVQGFGFDWGFANAQGFDWTDNNINGLGFDWGLVGAKSVVGESFATDSAADIPAEVTETSDDLLEIVVDGD